MTERWLSHVIDIDIHFLISNYGKLLKQMGAYIVLLSITFARQWRWQGLGFLKGHSGGKISATVTHRSNELIGGMSAEEMPTKRNHCSQGTRFVDSKMKKKTERNAG